MSYEHLRNLLNAVKLTTRRASEKVVQLQNRVYDSIFEWLRDTKGDVDINTEILLERALPDDALLQQSLGGQLPTQDSSRAFVEDLCGRARQLLHNNRLLWLAYGDWSVLGERLAKAGFFATIIEEWDTFSLMDWQRIHTYFALPNRKIKEKTQLATQFAGFAENWVAENLPEAQQFLCNLGKDPLGEVLLQIPNSITTLGWQSVMESFSWENMENREEITDWHFHIPIQEMIESLKGNKTPTEQAPPKTVNKENTILERIEVESIEILSEKEDDFMLDTFSEQGDSPLPAAGQGMGTEKKRKKEKSVHFTHELGNAGSITNHGKECIQALIQNQELLMNNQQQFLTMIKGLCASMIRTNAVGSEVHTLATGYGNLVNIIEGQFDGMKAMSVLLKKDINESMLAPVSFSKPTATQEDKPKQRLKNIYGGKQTNATTGKTGKEYQAPQKTINPNSWVQIAKKNKSKEAKTMPVKNQKIAQKMQATQAIKSKALEIKKNLRVDSRTLKLTAIEETTRKAQIGYRSYATAVETYLQKDVQNMSPRSVEDVRRDGRGTFYIQLKLQEWEKISKCWDMDSLHKEISLGGLGKWQLTTPSESPLKGFLPLVVAGIGLETDLEDALSEICISNAAYNLEKHRSLKSPTRLARWTNNQDGKGERLPSRSVLVWVEEGIQQQILEQGHIYYEFKILSVSKFNPPKLKCLHCGMVGSHMAKDCRNSPNCRKCHGKHDTIACPLSKPKTAVKRHSETEMQGPEKAIKIANSFEALTNLGEGEESMVLEHNDH